MWNVVVLNVEEDYAQVRYRQTFVRYPCRTNVDAAARRVSPRESRTKIKILCCRFVYSINYEIMFCNFNETKYIHE